MTEDWVSSSKNALNPLPKKWLSPLAFFLRHSWRKLEVGTRIAIATTLSLTSLTSLTQPVQAAMLAFWEFDPATNQLELTFTEESQPKFFLLNQPPRIVIDVPNTELGTEIRQQHYSGIVREIRVAQSTDGQTRIVMELVPGVVLAPELVQLEQIQPLRALTTGGDRWRLRPLIDESQIVALETTPTQNVANVPHHPDQLPPLPPVARRPNASSSGDRDTLPQIETSSEVESLVSVVNLPIPPSSTATEPEPEIIPETASNAVNTEPLSATVSGETTELIATLPLSELTLSARDRASVVSVPPIESRSADLVETVETSAPIRTSEPIVLEFGQPLPDVRSRAVVPETQPSSASVSPTDETRYSLPVEEIRRTDSPFVIVPALENTEPRPSNLPVRNNFGIGNSEQISRGSFSPTGVDIQLRYAGTEVLRLQPGASQSASFVLNQDFYDSAGNLVAPAGTVVNGYFESDRLGTQFIAQEIVTENAEISLTGESERIGGNREVSENRVALSSAIGAIAGAILGGLAGGNILEGAAAGTAIAYWTSPKPVLIQPGQIVQIRLSTETNF